MRRIVDVLMETTVMKTKSIFERSHIRIANRHKFSMKGLTFTHLEFRQYLIPITHKKAGCWLWDLRKFPPKLNWKLSGFSSLMSSILFVCLFVCLAWGQGSYKQLAEPMEEIIKLSGKTKCFWLILQQQRYWVIGNRKKSNGIMILLQVNFFLSLVYALCFKKRSRFIIIDRLFCE